MYRNICCKGLTLTVLLKRKVGRLSEVESEKNVHVCLSLTLVMHVFSAEIMSNYISVAYFGCRKDEERACRSCRRESECKTASTINSCTKMVLVTFLITCNKLESKGKAPRHSPNLFWSKKLNNLPQLKG